ncbi:NYN domain-containing protein [Pseudomonas sp. B1-22]|uniref:NYN domain-containing protein n=1 Tax=Pseudomonas sp. B1-22 TaxID=3141456 RepID=UPI003D284452
MSYNPYAFQVSELSSRIRNLQADQLKLDEQLKAFEEFDLEEQRQLLRETQSNLQTEEIGLLIDLKDLDQAKADHEAAKTQAQAGFDPRYWFSSQRAVAKQVLAACATKLSRISSKVDARKGRIHNLTESASVLDFNISQHLSTDILLLQARLNTNGIELNVLEEQLGPLRAKEAEINDLIGAQVSSLRELEARRSNLLSVIRTAEGFESALARAANSYERMEIHRKCETALGNGKPGVVISQSKGELRGVEANIEKLKRAIELAVSRASAEIKALVLDGNNLCNTQDGEFIGLRGLLAVVPLMLKKFRVTLIFDPGIRTKLKTTAAQLQALFPGAEVHVMKSKVAADETILNAAQFDTLTYIVSRDRFKDFPHLNAVKQQRVVGFTVLNNTISIESLNIHAPLKDEILTGA